MDSKKHWPLVLVDNDCQFGCAGQMFQASGWMYNAGGGDGGAMHHAVKCDPLYWTTEHVVVRIVYSASSKVTEKWNGMVGRHVTCS